MSPVPGLVAVTGASGHVGAALLRALIADGRRVRALDLRPPPGLPREAIDFRETDVLDPLSLREGLEGAATVFHLAAMISITSTPALWALNVDGARLVARTALELGVRRFVHCSSIHAFDLLHARGTLDENAPRSLDATLPLYDRSKAAGEEEVRKQVARGLDAVVVNPTGVIGPYDFAPSRMGRFFLALKENKVPLLVGGAFDWVDVRDVARGMLEAERRGRTGESYLLGGHRASMHELAVLASAHTGAKVPKLTVPPSLAQLSSEVALRFSTEGHRRALLFTPEALTALRCDPQVDLAKARQELAYQPRPLERTVADLCAWFTEQDRARRPPKKTRAAAPP